MSSSSAELQLSTARQWEFVDQYHVSQLTAILLTVQNQKSIISKHLGSSTESHQGMPITTRIQQVVVKAIYSVHGLACTLQTQTHRQFDTM